MATDSVGQVALDLELNEQPFHRSLSSLNSRASSTGAIIGKSLAKGLSVAGLTKFASDCIFAGSKLNAMRSLSSIAFPKMADDVQGFAKKASDGFGLSQKMALQYAGTFGSMAQGFGFTEKQAAHLSKTLTALSGDVASFYSMSQDEAYNKLQAVFTGETESLKSLGIVMTQNALDAYAMANGFGRTTNAMSEQEKVLLRYNFVLSQLSLAQGDFQRTQGAWGNQVKILKLHFQDLQAQLGQGLINVLKPAILALNIFMAKLVQVASVFSAWIAKITGANKKKSTQRMSSDLYSVGSAGTTAATGLGSVGKSAAQTEKSTKKASRALKKAQKELLGFDKMNKLAKKDKDTDKSSTPKASKGTGGVSTGGVTGDIGGLNEALDETSTKSKKLGKFWKVLGEIGKALGPALAPFKAVALQLWEGFFKPVLKIAGKGLIVILEGVAGALMLWGDFAKKHPKLAQFIVAVLTGLLIGRQLTKASNGVGLLSKGFKGLSKVFKILGKHPILLLITGIALAVGYVYKNWDKIKKTKAGKVIIKIGKVLKDIAKGALEKFRKGVEKVKNALKAFKEMWDGIKTKTAELKAEVKEKVEGALEKMKGAWDAISDKAAELTAEAKEKVAGALEKIKGWWGDINNKEATLTGKAEKKDSSTFDSLKDTFSNWKDKTAKAIGEAKDSLGQTYTNLKSKFDGWKDKAAQVIGSAVDSLGQTYTTLKGKFDGWVSKKAEIIGTAVDNIKESVLNSINKKWKKVKGGTKTFTAKVKDGLTEKVLNNIKKKWKKFKGGTKTFTAKLSDKLSGPLKKAWNAFAKGLNKIRSAVNKLPGVSIPAVPYMAQGGWVAKNTPQLAVVGDNRHEGEIVAPESKLAAMARMAAQQASGGMDGQAVALLQAILTAVTQIDAGVYIDGREITRTAVKGINQQIITTGKSPLLL